MSIKINGINNLINKINKLSNIESEKAVIEVAKDMEKAIKYKASTFSKNSNEIKAFEPKKFGNNIYIDVGLKSSESDWEKIKSLYFQNYGFYNKGWNFSGQYYIAEHKMWFDEVVQSKENECKSKLKAKLKEEIYKCWNG
ncbi:hypothetical protein FDB24_00090 [Clostridium botulinum]|uniref:hypothetical protein n=1 Tax=Clostridium botulinum TaxID=1491 RepID=UPI000772FED7|nr:hypothetical protein [Clostridium botulinum]NFL86229.1 hypothetical protein [Clostridium botulinum]NFO19696.1 hypothetical protein [Clostridium botulinum]